MRPRRPRSSQSPDQRPRRPRSSQSPDQRPRRESTSLRQWCIFLTMSFYRSQPTTSCKKRKATLRTKKCSVNLRRMGPAELAEFESVRDPTPQPSRPPTPQPTTPPQQSPDVPRQPSPEASVPQPPPPSSSHQPPTPTPASEPLFSHRKRKGKSTRRAAQKKPRVDDSAAAAAEEQAQEEVRNAVSIIVASLPSHPLPGNFEPNPPPGPNEEYTPHPSPQPSTSSAHPAPAEEPPLPDLERNTPHMNTPLTTPTLTPLQPVSPTDLLSPPVEYTPRHYLPAPPLGTPIREPATPSTSQPSASQTPRPVHSYPPVSPVDFYDHQADYEAIMLTNIVMPTNVQAAPVSAFQK